MGPARMKRWRLVLVLLSAALSGCGASDAGPVKAPLDPLSTINAGLAFTCVHETIPAPTAESDVLFQYARWLQKNNQRRQEKNVNAEIERLYRIAAENGHYKANINLQNGTMRGEFQLRGEEYLRLSQSLIDAGVARGYHFIGIFLKNGSAGLQQNPEMALRYFRKAADQGNAQAQASVGDRLAPSDIAPNISRQMRRCAAEQGHGGAAVELGASLKRKGHYQQALEAFQMAVAAGNESAASRLEKSFGNSSSSNELHYLGQQEDLERAERYEKIRSILADYSYADPKVPEINEILPLPPAQLPPWDGKLQWLEARLANVPPEKPSAALINELAKAKVLDPATGKPIPGSPAFSLAHLSACLCSQSCPQSEAVRGGLLG